MAERKRSSTRSNRRRKNNSAVTGNPNSYKHLYQGSAGQTVPSAQDITPAAAVGKGSESVDWKDEYGYVIRDLRILFLVSILIFVAMIAAGFVLWA